MLRPDPAQQPRLQEIRSNLHARLAEAHQQGWQGEIDGLEFSIRGADQKLASMNRGRPATDLGMPSLPSPNDREIL